MNSDKLTEDVQEPARRWLNLLPALTNAQSELERIKLDLIATQNEVGEKLAPPDAKVGETFHFWVRWPKESKSDVLLKVICIADERPKEDPPKPKWFNVGIRWTNHIP